MRGRETVQSHKTTRHDTTGRGSVARSIKPATPLVERHAWGNSVGYFLQQQNGEAVFFLLQSAGKLTEKKTNDKKIQVSRVHARMSSPTRFAALLNKAWRKAQKQTHENPRTQRVEQGRQEFYEIKRRRMLRLKKRRGSSTFFPRFLFTTVELSTSLKT